MRPIAVGDVLRRLVGKAILATPACRDAIASLAPPQVGVGVPGAAEAAAMTMQALASKLRSASPWVALQVDFSNAFNCVHRPHLLHQGMVRVPAAYNYLRFAYGRTTRLFCGQEVILSRCGTQQGCPMGPLGFALALQPIAESLQQTGGLVWSTWYLDDGLLVGSPEAIHHALIQLQTLGPTIGLSLNLQKCVLWGPGAKSVPGHEQLTVPDWEKGEGITVLGIPVDHPDHPRATQAAWESAVSAMERLLGRLATVPDAQLVHHLLRSCVDACRVNHLLRATDPTHSARHAAKAETAIIDAFEGLLGVTLLPSQRTQITRPLRMGGCGVKNPTTVMFPARISALASFYGGGGARVGAPAYLLPPDTALLRGPLLGLQETLGSSFDPLAAWVQDGTRILGATAEQRTQHWWGDAVARRLRQDLLDVVSHRDQARLLELADGVGTCWMTVPPSSAARTIISSDDYCLAMRWHLGLPLVPAPAPCPGCGRQADTFGDHFLCCPRNDFSLRHHAVRDALFAILSANGEAVTKEVPLAHAADDQLRPADLLLPGWKAGGPTAVDVTVTHGWTLAHASATAAPTREKWRAFLKQKEAAKHTKYDAPCQREGWHFEAVALGTWGGLGPEGALFLAKALKRATAWQDGSLKAVRQVEHREAIGLALMRQVWSLLSAKNFLPEPSS